MAMENYDCLFSFQENIVSPSPDKFFDLITRLQGRRMDDQRVEMRDDGDGNGEAARNDIDIAEPIANPLDGRIPAVANNEDQGQPFFFS